MFAACVFAGLVPFAVYTTDVKDLQGLCESHVLPDEAEQLETWSMP